MESAQDKSKKFVLWFNEIGKDDIALVGGKNANLGELYCNLTTATSQIFPEEKIAFLDSLPEILTPPATRMLSLVISAGCTTAQGM